MGKVSETFFLYKDKDIEFVDSWPISFISFVDGSSWSFISPASAETNWLSILFGIDLFLHSKKVFFEAKEEAEGVAIEVPQKLRSRILIESLRWVAASILNTKWL